MKSHMKNAGCEEESSTGLDTYRGQKHMVKVRPHNIWAAVPLTIGGAISEGLQLHLSEFVVNPVHQS